MIDKELTHKIIGCCMKVHRVLGSGYPEVIYQRALVIEFQKSDITFNREMEMDIFYEGTHIGKRRVDFYVEDKIMLELKAIGEISDLHIAQTMNYCQLYDLPFGLLINFGGKSLEYKRVYNLKHKDKKS